MHHIIQVGPLWKLTGYQQDVLCYILRSVGIFSMRGREEVGPEAPHESMRTFWGVWGVEIRLEAAL